MRGSFVALGLAAVLGGAVFASRLASAPVPAPVPARRCRGPSRQRCPKPLLRLLLLRLARLSAQAAAPECGRPAPQPLRARLRP